MVTGVSGSGKSTLAFDILFAEGQRRYLESLNAYARQFVQPAARPDVDAIFGIPPTVAIEQRTSRGGRKSTVATLTEIYHFLRLLYVKLGTQHCPYDGTPIEPQSEDAIAARLARDYAGRRIALLAPLVVARKGYYTDLAKWAARKGYRRAARGRRDAADAALAAARPLQGAYDRAAGGRARRDRRRPSRHCARRSRARSSSARASCTCSRGRSKASRHGATLPARDAARWPRRRGRGVLDQARVPLLQPQLPRARPAPVLVQLEARLVPDLLSAPASKLQGLRRRADRRRESGGTNGTSDDEDACPACDGKRLNPRRSRCASAGARSPSSRSSRWAMPRGFCGELDLSGREAEIARDIVGEIASRLGFLADVGLGYLALDRSAPTLSGGEAQRIRLAAQLGSNLRGVCYILDEPTIGLHPRDNRVLLDTLAKLAGEGQHAGGRRARRGHHPPRRPRHRPRARRGQPRRRTSSRRAPPTS